MPKGIYERKPKSIIGDGVNDLKWSGKHNKCTDYEVRVYNTWYGMLKRCYNESSLKKEPSYRGCTVCERWKVLSNFEQDIQTLKGYDNWVQDTAYSLDKDILGNNSKVYSPQTCCFVTLADNIKERNQRVGNPSIDLKKPIFCIHPDGKKEIFESINSTSKAGFTPPNVIKVLQGKRKKHKGCRFCFIA